MHLVRFSRPSFALLAALGIALAAALGTGALPVRSLGLIIAAALVGLVLGLALDQRRGRGRLLVRLRRSEERFRGVAETSVSGILMFNADGWLIFANRRWQAMTGKALGGGNKLIWLDALAPSVRPLLWEAWQATMESGARFEALVPYRRADGADGFADLSIDPERDDQGRLSHLVVRLTDQTARAHAEASLTEREQLYRLLADHGSDLILRLSSEGTILFASQAAQRLLDWSPEALVGQPLPSLVHPEDRAALEQPLRGTPGAPASVAFRMLTGSQDYRWVEVTLNRLAQGREWVASLRDIAARRLAEERRANAERKLRESNRLLTLAEGLASVGHWHASAKRQQVFFSQEAQTLLGLAEPHCSFASAIALVHPGDRLRLLRAAASSARRTVSGECQLRLGSGGPDHRTLLVRMQADRGADGRVLATFGVVTDITERLAADARLLAVCEEARAAALSKAAFLATMSHEIRTPMTGVLGMIELLRGHLSEAERTAYLDTLQQSADLLMTVLNDILDFSRIDGGHLELAAQPFNLRDVVGATAQLFERNATAKGLALTVEDRVSGQLDAIGDRVRLQQVLSNLVNNAIKFTDRGAIRLTLSAAAERNGRRRWRIAVRDTGIGISEADQQRLFEPFVQADTGSDRRFGGTGLGLAISRRLVEAMGGKLKLRSTLGKGSTFWLELTLPCAPLVTAARPAPTLAASRTSASAPLNILLAEDNRVNQLLVTTLLRRLGHRVDCADDGRAAVTAAAGQAYDLILMDMQMPRLDGLAAARAIRASGGPCAASPIVALTADASPERRAFYAGEALDGFLAKPIDSAALRAMLDEVACRSPDQPSSDRVDQGLDPHQLGEIHAALGPARTAELLDLFRAELAARPTAIRQALGCSDLAAAAAEAHSLKGAAVSIGGSAVGAAAAALERALATHADGQSIELHRSLRDLDRAVRSTIEALPSALVAAPPRAA